MQVATPATAVSGGPCQGADGSYVASSRERYTFSATDGSSRVNGIRGGYYIGSSSNGTGSKPPNSSFVENAVAQSSDFGTLSATEQQLVLSLAPILDVYNYNGSDICRLVRSCGADEDKLQSIVNGILEDKRGHEQGEWKFQGRQAQQVRRSRAQQPATTIASGARGAARAMRGARGRGGGPAAGSSGGYRSVGSENPARVFGSRNIGSGVLSSVTVGPASPATERSFSWHKRLPAGGDVPSAAPNDAPHRARSSSTIRSKSSRASVESDGRQRNRGSTPSRSAAVSANSSGKARSSRQPDSNVVASTNETGSSGVADALAGAVETSREEDGPTGTNDTAASSFVPAINRSANYASRARIGASQRNRGWRSGGAMQPRRQGSRASRGGTTVSNWNDDRVAAVKDEWAAAAASQGVDAGNASPQTVTTTAALSPAVSPSNVAPGGGGLSLSGSGQQPAIQDGPTVPQSAPEFAPAMSAPKREAAVSVLRRGVTSAKGSWAKVAASAQERMQQAKAAEKSSLLPLTARTGKTSEPTVPRSDDFDFVMADTFTLGVESLAPRSSEDPAKAATGSLSSAVTTTSPQDGEPTDAEVARRGLADLTLGETCLISGTKPQFFSIGGAGDDDEAEVVDETESVAEEINPALEEENDVAAISDVPTAEQDAAAPMRGVVELTEGAQWGENGSISPLPPVRDAGASEIRFHELQPTATQPHYPAAPDPDKEPADSSAGGVAASGFPSTLAAGPGSTSAVGGAASAALSAAGHDLSAAAAAGRRIGLERHSGGVVLHQQEPLLPVAVAEPLVRATAPRAASSAINEALMGSGARMLGNDPDGAPLTASLRLGLLGTVSAERTLNRSTLSQPSVGISLPDVSAAAGATGGAVPSHSRRPGSGGDERVESTKATTGAKVMNMVNMMMLNTGAKGKPGSPLEATGPGSTTSCTTPQPNLAHLPLPPLPTVPVPQQDHYISHTTVPQLHHHQQQHQQHTVPHSQADLALQSVHSSGIGSLTSSLGGNAPITPPPPQQPQHHPQQLSISQLKADPPGLMLNSGSAPASTPVPSTVEYATSMASGPMEATRSVQQHHHHPHQQVQQQQHHHLLMQPAALHYQLQAHQHPASSFSSGSSGFTATGAPMSHLNLVPQRQFASQVSLPPPPPQQQQQQQYHHQQQQQQPYPQVVTDGNGSFDTSGGTALLPTSQQDFGLPGSAYETDIATSPSYGNLMMMSGRGVGGTFPYNTQQPLSAAAPTQQPLRGSYTTASMNTATFANPAAIAALGTYQQQHGTIEARRLEAGSNAPPQTGNSSQPTTTTTTAAAANSRVLLLIQQQQQQQQQQQLQQPHTQSATQPASPQAQSPPLTGVVAQNTQFTAPVGSTAVRAAGRQLGPRAGLQQHQHQQQHQQQQQHLQQPQRVSGSGPAGAPPVGPQQQQQHQYAAAQHHGSGWSPNFVEPLPQQLQLGTAAAGGARLFPQNPAAGLPQHLYSSDPSTGPSTTCLNNSSALPTAAFAAAPVYLNSATGGGFFNQRPCNSAVPDGPPQHLGSSTTAAFAPPLSTIQPPPYEFPRGSLQLLQQQQPQQLYGEQDNHSALTPLQINAVGAVTGLPPQQQQQQHASQIVQQVSGVGAGPHQEQQQQDPSSPAQRTGAPVAKPSVAQRGAHSSQSTSYPQQQQQQAPQPQPQARSSDSQQQQQQQQHPSLQMQQYHHHQQQQQQQQQYWRSTPSEGTAANHYLYAVAQRAPNRQGATQYYQRGGVGHMTTGGSVNSSSAGSATTNNGVAPLPQQQQGGGSGVFPRVNSSGSRRGHHHDVVSGGGPNRRNPNKFYYSGNTAAPTSLSGSIHGTSEPSSATAAGLSGEL